MDRDANIANARQISEQIVDYLTAGAGRVEERIARAFVKLLHKTFNKCTNENVQVCPIFQLSPHFPCSSMIPSSSAKHSS